MPGSATAKKLDLSKLTDAEAKHVWEVVQRDFDLRKKEENRLGVLKTKIEKEDFKIELLGEGSILTESYCIRCLQPFKFLVNSKRQCLDCHLYICKSCCRYNKKEKGSVCNSCHMARVLKIGTLEWYYENVRARFKRFGSAKVMRSLFKRLSLDQSDSGDGYEDHSMDTKQSQHYKEIRKVKRRLTVDPIDFEVGWDKPESRGPFYQDSDSHDMVLVTSVAERESMLADADMASVFQQIAAEQHTDVLVYSENPTIPSRSVSQLSHSSCGSGSAGAQRGGGSIYLLGPDDTEDEADDGNCHQYIYYRSHLSPWRHTSQESLNYANAPPQASSPPDSESGVRQKEEADLEEQQLRQKLHEMTNNISDHSGSSDEEDSKGPQSSHQIKAWRRRSLDFDTRPSRIPTRPTSRASIIDLRVEEEPPQQNDSPKMNHMMESVERKLQSPEQESQASFKGSTALLVELEDQIAQAAADVQNAKSEVSFIEDRIAALNAAGMPVDKRRKSAIPVQSRRLSQSITKASYDAGFLRRRLSLA